MLNTVEEGLEDIRQGKVLIVVDDEDRENEGDFIVSGEKITPEIVNFMITHGRGLPAYIFVLLLGFLQLVLG